MKKKYIVWALGLFLGFKILSWLFRSVKGWFNKKEEIVTIPTITPPPQEAAVSTQPAAESTNELVQLVTTGDWNVTAPGKYLSQFLVDPSFVNWILWPINALVIFFVLRSIIDAVRGTKRSGGGGSSGTVGTVSGLALFAVFGFAIYLIWGQWQEKEVAAQPTVLLDLRQYTNEAQINTSSHEVLTLLPHQGMVVRYHKDGLRTNVRGADLQLYVCPRVTYPAGFEQSKFVWTGGGELRLNDGADVQRIARKLKPGQKMEVYISLRVRPTGDKHCPETLIDR